MLVYLFLLIIFLPHKIINANTKNFTILSVIVNGNVILFVVVVTVPIFTIGFVVSIVYV